MSLEVSKTTLIASEGEFSPEKIELIKRTICPGISNLEFEFFIEVCKRTGLNPLLKQIYSIPRGNTRTIQISIDGYRIVADRTGKYAPGRESTFVYDEDKKIVSATAYVMKQTPDGKWHEVASSAYWAEYNANQGLWKKMPHVMLSKCAEAACLRKAFPAEFLGTYTQEEMQQADKEPIQEEVLPIVTYQMVCDAWQDLMNLIPSADGLRFAGYATHIESKFREKYPKNFEAEIVKYIETCQQNASKFAEAMNKWYEAKNK